MLKPVFIVAAVLVAPLPSPSGDAQAGDAWEEYFLIVASVMAKPYAEYRFSEFNKEIENIRNEYSLKCGVDVDAWHSDLVEGFEKEHIFVYSFSDEDRAVVDAFSRNDQCSKDGYIKGGLVVVPSDYQYCSNVPNRSQDYRNDPQWQAVCQ